MLIKVFKGQWRGIGEDGGKASYAMVGFNFREHLHHFKGPKWGIFTSIMLHMDENGLSFPSYDTIKRETGYGRDTIAKTLKELCETEIKGRPVLLKWRNRDAKGRYTGPNQYKVFPTDAEIKLMADHSQEKPTMDTPNVGAALLEVEPLKKEEPLKEPAAQVVKPQNGSKAKGEKKPRPRDLLFDAVAEVSKLDPVTAGSFIGKAANLLRKGKRTPEQVKLFEKIWYTREFPGGLKDHKPPSPESITRYISWVDEKQPDKMGGEKFNEYVHAFDFEEAA